MDRCVLESRLFSDGRTLGGSILLTPRGFCGDYVTVQYIALCYQRIDHAFLEESYAILVGSY